MSRADPTTIPPQPHQSQIYCPSQANPIANFLPVSLGPRATSRAPALWFFHQLPENLTRRIFGGVWVFSCPQLYLSLPTKTACYPQKPGIAPSIWFLSSVLGSRSSVVRLPHPFFSEYIHSCPCLYLEIGLKRVHFYGGDSALPDLPPHLFSHLPHSAL